MINVATPVHINVSLFVKCDNRRGELLLAASAFAAYCYASPIIYRFMTFIRAFRARLRVKQRYERAGPNAVRPSQ